MCVPVFFFLGLGALGDGAFLASRFVVVLTDNLEHDGRCRKETGFAKCFSRGGLVRQVDDETSGGADKSYVSRRLLVAEKV